MMGVRSAGAAAAERPLSAEGGMWWQHALSGLSEWLGEDCFFGAHACACGFRAGQCSSPHFASVVRMLGMPIGR